ncbi:MAG: ATP-binding protein [Spirochaetales bacterium]|nr:ATP-binding protein [Spirochaetales bacterium]
MYRFAEEYLKEWRIKSNRKPLIIRGARQVGKSYLIREFAYNYFENVIEIDFEKKLQLKSLFVSNDINIIIRNLEIQFKTTVIPGKTLLFFDEIQAAPEILKTLRYFYEDLPDIHIITAGSLLEMVFSDHSFSLPVGRVEFLYLGPFTFEEFLLGTGEEKIYSFLTGLSIKDNIPESIHNKILSLLKIFLIIGGMPEAIKIYHKEKSLRAVDMVNESIITTFQDDFNKYGTKADRIRMIKLFQRIPLIIGKKFKYSRIDSSERSKDIKAALNLLDNARVITSVFHSSGNGLPLGAEKNEKHFKIIFLDVGLLSKLSGLNILVLDQADDILTINNGVMCEQFIGQHLLYFKDWYQKPELYYWIRERKNSSAEIDYLITFKNMIIPVEVKAGKTGTLKSMQLFFCEKDCHIGLRFNTDTPSVFGGTTSLPGSKGVAFKLLSLPLYLVGQAGRLLGEMPL